MSKLQSDIAPLAKNTGDPTLSQVSDSEAAAKDTVTKIMGYPIDQKFHNESLVQALLKQPITNVDVPLKLGPAASASNAAGKSLCAVSRS